MACVSLSDAIAGYWFWILSGKPWGLDGLKNHYYERALKKNFAKYRINKTEYEMLKRARDNMLDKLSRHENWADGELNARFKDHSTK